MSIYKFGTLEELSASLDSTQPVYLDTETSKLGSQIRLVQVYQEHWEQVLLFDTVDTSVSVLWFILVDKHLVLHNGWYDFGCFIKDMPKGAFELPERWDDTFYLSRLAYPKWNTGKGYSLDAALLQVLGYDPYAKEKIDKKKLQMSFERLKVKDVYIEGADGLKELTEEQLLYASIDVYELPHLYKAVKSKCKHFVYKLDELLIITLASDEKGMPVDPAMLTELEQEDIVTIAAIKKEIGALNCNSYMQVRKALGTIMSSDEMALSIIQSKEGGITNMWFRTKLPQSGKWPKALKAGLDGGTISVETRSFGKSIIVASSSELPTDKNVLTYFREDYYEHSDEIVRLANRVIAMRKSLKRLNFVERARAAMDADNRIQAHYSPHAINGRIQQSDENLTQYPRAMKKMWGHPEGNGRKLIYSDFAQIELRIICAALPEMNMYKALKEGKDIHSFVAEQFNFSEKEIALLPKGQNPRQVAKQSNFLLLYGGGETNFQRVVCRNSGVWFSDDMTHNIVTKWKSIFSDITEWHTRNSNSTTKMDKTVCGRPYKAALVTDLNNIKVSGTGSEIFKLALWYIHKHIITQFDDIYVVNRVHDSITLDVPDDIETNKKIARLVTLCFQAAWFEVTKLAPLTDVPMPVDVGIGSNMAGIEYEYGVDYSFTLDPYYMMGKELDDEVRKSL